MNDSTIDTLISIFAKRKITATPVMRTLNVQKGQGPNAHKANLDLEALTSLLATQSNHPRLLAGFAAGVEGVLLEPPRSRAAAWDYSRTAGRLVPNLEVASFGLGVTAATGGDPAWTMPFHDDLILTVVVELDHGRRVLTRSQVDRWGASDDRVIAAARSMLFHKTRHVSWRPTDHSELQMIHTGDGFDAIRCIVFSDAFYSDVSDDYRFSIPDQDTLIFSPESDDESIANLKRETQRVWDRSEYPLTTTVFGFELGKPVPTEL